MVLQSAKPRCGRQPFGAKSRRRQPPKADAGGHSPRRAAGRAGVPQIVPRQAIKPSATENDGFRCAPPSCEVIRSNPPGGEPSEAAHECYEKSGAGLLRQCPARRSHRDSVARIDQTPFQIDILDLSHDGRGVARREDGKAVFVSGALPGERVLAQQTARSRSFDEAKTLEVLTASPDRVAARCPHFGTCGGCALQHLAEDRQIHAKQRVLLENLERIGHVTPGAVLEPLTDAAWGYRRKGRFSVRRVEKNAPIYGMAPLEQLLGTYLTQRRFQTSLLTGFSIVALLMAAVGIYGLIEYSVATRTQEIGLRMAIGAQRGDIFRMMIGEGLMLSLTGVALGLVGAWWLGRAGSSLLFGVTASDPLVFTTVSLLLTAVAMAACYFPARRAMRVDPILALRVT